MTARVTDQPHEVLERAANLLEERAGKATPGLWEEYANGYIWDADGDCIISERTRRDGQGIATMSPAVAAPLVAWLRTEANYARVLKGFCAPAAEDMHVEHALTFARMVLGEAT